MFIVELEPGVFIAPWGGDPGRTVIAENAKQYKSFQSADRDIKKARQWRAFPRATVKSYSECGGGGYSCQKMYLQNAKTLYVEK